MRDLNVVRAGAREAIGSIRVLLIQYAVLAASHVDVFEHLAGTMNTPSHVSSDTAQALRYH